MLRYLARRIAYAKCDRGKSGEKNITLIFKRMQQMKKVKPYQIEEIQLIFTK